MRRDALQKLEYPKNLIMGIYGNECIDKNGCVYAKIQHDVNEAINTILSTNDVNKRRMDIIIDYYKHKKSTSMMCAIYGVSRSRIFELLRSGECMIRQRVRCLNSDDEMSKILLNLSCRTASCLRRGHLDTKSKITDALHTGKILTIRNLGFKSLMEIANCVGYDVVSDPQYRNMIYCHDKSSLYKDKIELVPESIMPVDIVKLYSTLDNIIDDATEETKDDLDYMLMVLEDMKKRILLKKDEINDHK